MVWQYFVVAVVGWLAASAMAPKINAPRSRDDGTRTSKAATDEYIPKIYGSVGKHEGITVFKNTNDGDDDSVKNDLLHIIICWGQAVQSIDMIYIDDIPINSPAFLWDPNDDNNDPESPRLAYVRNFPNGFTPGYSDTKLTEAGISGTDKFQGKAVSYIRLEYSPNRNVFRGEPQITADITGTSTSNPAEHLLDYLTNAEYGKGLSTAFLDTTKFNDAIALCNAQVPQYEGAAENRKLFTCNFALDTSKLVIENINILLQSMRALMPIIDGKLTPIIEQDEAPVSFELTEDLIVDLGSIKNSNKSNRYNRVIVKYTEPNANWTAQEVVYEQADWLAEDNGIVLEKSVDLPTCTNYYEAGAFARTIAQISREQLRVEIEANPISVQLEVGDIVNVSHSFPGWVQKPFRVETTEQLSSGNVKFTLREHQPYLYDYYHTGDKPSIPDSSIIRSAPSAPINVNQNPVFNDYAQVIIDWESSALRFDYVLTKYTDRGLESEETVTITSGQTATNEALLNGLELGDYRFSVRSKAGAGQSSLYTNYDFLLNAPQTSLDPATVEVTPGRIVITPPTPSRSTMVYECVYTLNSSLTLTGATPDPISSFNDLGAGLSFAISGIVSGSTYYIWYRLRSAEGYGEWVQESVVAQATYTWRVYADDNAGTNISLTDSGKDYVGYAFNRTVATPDLTDPSIYDWFINTGAVNGYNTAQVLLFIRSASPPTKPTNNLVYTFSTATFSLPPNNGWYANLADVPPGDDPVWAIVASAVSQSSTDVVAASEWTAPFIYVQDGVSLNTRTVFLFARTATNAAPTDPGATTYDFDTQQLTGALNDWTTSLSPTGGPYRWMISATAASYTSTDTIQPSEWSDAALTSEDGDDGQDSVFGFFIHDDGDRAVKDKNGLWSPAVDTQQASRYEFYRGNTKISWGSLSWEVNSATDTLNVYNALTSPNGEAVTLTLNPLNGESDSPTAIITHDGSGVSIAVTFSTTRHGEDGTPGDAGQDGTLFITIAGSVWSNSAASAAIAAIRPLAVNDNVTITNDLDFSETRFWDGGAWVKVSFAVDGNFVVNEQAIINKLAANSIDASKINVSTLSIEDANWGATIKISANGVQSGLGYSNYILIDYNQTDRTAISARNQLSSSSRPVIVAETNGNSLSGQAFRGVANNGATAVAGLTQLGGRAFHASANATSYQNTKGIEVDASAGATGLWIWQTNPVGHTGNSSIYILHGSASHAAIDINGATTAIDAEGDVNVDGDIDVTGNIATPTINGLKPALLGNNGANDDYLLVSRNGGATGAVIANKNTSGHIATFRVNGSTDKSWINFNTGELDTSSSIRHKTIIERDYDTLDRICELGQKGVSKTVYKVGDGSVLLTLIAEEVLYLFPEAVRYDEFGRVTGLSYNQVFANIPTAIYQLNEKADAVSALVESLITRIEALENT